MQPLARILYRCCSVVPQRTVLLIRAAQSVVQQQQQQLTSTPALSAPPPQQPTLSPPLTLNPHRPIATFTFRGNRASRQQQQQEEEARRRRRRGGAEEEKAAGGSGAATASAAAAQAEAAARELLARRGGALPFAVTAREAVAAFEAEQSRRCLRLHASGVLDEALKAYDDGQGGEEAATPDEAAAAAAPGDDPGATPSPPPPSQRPRLEPLLVPFWAFQTTVSARVTAATLGYRDDPSGPIAWRERVFDAAAVAEDELLGGVEGGGGAAGASSSSSSSSGGAEPISPELERAAAELAVRRLIPWSAPAMQVCASLELRRDLAEGAKPLWEAAALASETSCSLWPVQFHLQHRTSLLG